MKTKLLLYLFIGFYSLSNLAQTPKTFNSDDTFTVPGGVSEITIEAWGGGGAGGTATSGAAGGGGSGAYSKSTITVTPGDKFSITVGSGGTTDNGGVGSSEVNGEESKVTDANDASDVKVLAKGGNSTDGGLNDPDGAPGGSVTGAVGKDVKSPGNDGADATPKQTPTESGKGGSAPNGGAGGASVKVSDDLPGEDGTSPGGGGSGAASNSGELGGAGANGRVVITYTRIIQNTSGDFDVASNWNNGVLPSPTGDNFGAIDEGVISTLTGNESINYLTLENNSKIELGSNNLNVKGNLENKSQFTGSGKVIFNGTSNQELSGNGNYSNLKLNNDGEIDINGNITATGDFINSSQLVRLNSSNLNVEGNITNNSEFDLNGNTLNVKGNITNNNPPSTGFTGNGEVVLNGSTTQELSGNGAYDDLTLNNDVTINSQSVLNVNGNITRNANITFKSNDLGTAQFGKFTGGTISGSGEVTVERFVPKSNRAFRYISSPVNTSGTINENLQEGATTASTTPNPKPGFGTHITGDKNANRGFDATQTGNSSMFKWNEDSTTPDWEAISNTDNNTLSVGEAYALMIRGDRSTSLNSNTIVGPATTLRFTGTLKTGNKQVADANLSGTSGNYNLIANPYQAIVDAKSLLQGGDATDLDDQTIYVYDPTLGDQGGYATVDISKTTPTSTPSGTEANENILPNQAFFVETTGNSPALTFKEKYKSVNAGLVDTFSENNILSEMRINLKRQTEDLLVDGVTTSFDAQHTNKVTNADADKFWNYSGSESVALFNSDNYLSIEKRATPAANDTLQLYTYNYQADAYEWQIDMSNINREAVLVDNYLDTETPLNADGKTNIYFNVDSNIPESSNTFRFSIKFTNETLGIDNPKETNFTVYPNPVTNKQFTISGLSGSGNTDVQLFDMTGKLVFKTTESVESNMTIDLNKSLPSGVYQLQLTQDQAQYQSTLIIAE